MPKKLKNREYTNKKGLVKKDHLHKFLTKPIIGAGISFGLGVGVTFGGIALYNHANPKESTNINDERPTYEKIYSGIIIPDKLTDKGGISFDDPKVNFPTYVKLNIKSLDSLNKLKDEIHNANIARDQALQYNADFNRAKLDAGVSNSELKALSEWYKSIVIQKEDTDDKGYTFNKPNIHFPTYVINNNIDFSDIKIIEAEITKALIAKQSAIDYNNEYNNNRNYSIEKMALDFWNSDSWRSALPDYRVNEEKYNKLRNMVLGIDNTDTITGEFGNLQSSFPLYLPKVTSIGIRSFNSAITSLSLPEVTSIGEQAFVHSPITSLSLPKVTSIGDSAFTSSMLTSLSLPEATSIGNLAFEASMLTSLSIPKVTSIGQQAFEASLLTSLSLPEVTSISAYTFLSSKFVSIYLPKITNLSGAAWGLSTDNQPIPDSIPIPNDIDNSNPGFFAFPSNNDATEAEYLAWESTQTSDDPITDPLEFIDQFNLNIESTDEAKKIY